VFKAPGRLTLEHRTRDRTYTLADVTATEDEATPSLNEVFTILRTDRELSA
jgi:hypothetical protein